MTKNLLAREAIWFFEQKAHENVNEAMTNYELVMQDLKTHFFPKKDLQCQNRHLCWGLFKPRNYNMRTFIYRINDIVD